MKDLFEKYLLELRNAYDKGGTEHSGRTALENFLNAAKVKLGAKVQIQHEPKQQEGKGAPDFMVSQSGMIVGYVETKAIGADLNTVRKSPQIKKYRELKDNILLTDYLHFIWINGDEIQRESIAYPDDLKNPKFVPREERIQIVGKLLEGFFSTPPEGVARAQTLALELAKRSQLLRDFLGEVLVRQEKEDKGGKLYGLFKIFRDQVFHELTVKEFADAFAQMLAYGLFLAKLNAERQEVNLHNVKQYIPGSFNLIRELVDFLDLLENDPYQDIRWVVREILSIVNGMDLARIHGDLSFKNRRVRRGIKATSEDEARLFERDPFVYFYEDYLSRYDPKLRESRGVYYTPPPVVNFIVRAIDDILKDKDLFSINDGLADHNRVTVLDFACGTGTFLVEVFESIFETIGGPDTGKAGLVVRDHMLKNIFGFEYLIAPYTIAHLKLSQYLADRGHELEKDERLQVFLTNTLEPIEPQANMLLPELTHEVEVAQEVKEKPILVITGNPPYSGHSRNMGAVARASVQEYKKGFPDLNKPGQGKWLQDDYVKFIRFAQTKMDAVEEGVVGVITNHSYLDNPTFKGMRKSLMETFDQIYILDLHGSTKKKEKAPDGGDDQNVFDIQQGVAIAFFVKQPEAEKGIWHSDFWGKRLSKYEACVNSEFGKIHWEEITPIKPLYLFRPWDEELAQKYRDFWSVPEIFSPIGDPAPGIVTTHDQFAVSFTKEEAIEKVERLLSTTTEAEARRHFRLCKQSQWSYDDTKRELADGAWQKKTIPILYRLFDERWTIWDSHVAVHRRLRVMTHMRNANLGLLSVRQTVSDQWSHVFICEGVTDDCVLSNRTKERGYVLPLYRYVPDKSENLSPDFRAFIDEKYDDQYSAEEMLGYIYAVLHAPTYREKYAEFLRIDFPRIPFPEESGEFEALSELGWDLTQKHLLRDVPDLGLGKYEGKGNNEVGKPSYELAGPKGQRLYINQTQYFAPVPGAAWAFQIGGYQVLSKYLKDRKGRTLSLDEIINVENIVNVLTYTFQQMRRIEDTYLKAFPDGDN